MKRLFILGKPCRFGIAAINGPPPARSKIKQEKIHKRRGIRFALLEDERAPLHRKGQLLRGLEDIEIITGYGVV